MREHRQMLRCPRGYTEKRRNIGQSVASEKMEINRLEAAMAFTEHLPCPQDCVKCCGWSRSDCPQGAQNLGSILERVCLAQKWEVLCGVQSWELHWKEGWSDQQRDSISQTLKAKVMVVSYSGVNEEAQMKSYIWLAGVGLELQLETTSGWLLKPQPKGQMSQGNFISNTHRWNGR